jgi:O-antigen ligase
VLFCPFLLGFRCEKGSKCKQILELGGQTPGAKFAKKFEPGSSLFVNRFHDAFSLTRPYLPGEGSACWAALFFSLSILTLLFSLAASQLFLAAAGIAYAVHLFLNHPRIAFLPVKAPLALFACWTVLSTFFANNPAAGGFAIRKLVLFVIFLLAVNLIVSMRHLETLCRALFVEAAAASVYATIQFLTQYRTVRAEHPHHIYSIMTSSRVTGFMGHWMNFGGQQMMVFAILLACLFLRPRTRAIWWLVAAIIASSILLNLTRGVWLGCFVAGLYLVARWKPKLLWFVPILVAVLLLASPKMVRERVDSVLHPSNDNSISMRLEIWSVGLRMIQEHPWVGVGPNNINEQYDLYLPPGVSPAAGYHAHMHNDYLQFAAERGLPCLAAYLWLIGALFWHYLKIRRISPASSRWIVDGAIAAWMAMVVEGFFEFNFGTSPVLMMFLFIASTPFVAAQVQRFEAEPERR